MTIDVKLNVFEGPLDLLLHLIEKNKVDIYDIPISEITSQYLEYIQAMQEENLDIISEFLVMAATLLKIKAKMLLPAAESDEEEEDPREELVRRLIEYKIFKYASTELKKKGQEATKSFYKQADIPEEVLQYKEPVDPKEVIGDVTMGDLQKVFNFVMRKRENKVDPIRSKFGDIKTEEVRLEDKVVEIEQYIFDRKKISFYQLLETQETKEEVVVTFLAVLELMKIGKITATQANPQEDIMIETLE